MLPFMFWSFADWILDNYKRPEGVRSAISRGYYAAFHAVKEFLEGMGITILTRIDGHKDVWDHLLLTGDAEMEKTGKSLSDLRSDRNGADYNLDEKQYESEPTARGRLEDARQIIASINKW